MNPLAHRSLITLDLDDTLWPCAPVIRAAEAELIAWLGATAPRLAACHDPISLRDHRVALMRARPDLAHDLTLIRRLSLAALFRQFGYDEGLADTATEVFRVARNRVTPWPEVAPVLGRLRRRFCLVSVTNGNAEVHETPLAGLFHCCLTAAEAGAARPDPTLFRLALEFAGVGPDAAVHLGDDPYRDIEPARALGMAAIWVNRHQATWPAELAPPDWQITDLTVLLNWLDALGVDRVGAADG